MIRVHVMNKPEQVNDFINSQRFDSPAISHKRWLQDHTCSCASSSSQQVSVAATAQFSKYLPFAAAASSALHVARYSAVSAAAFGVRNCNVMVRER
jgi:hypothetical protein